MTYDTNLRAAVGELLRQIDEFPELNMNNYTDDQVRELNYWGVRLALAAQEMAAQQKPDPRYDARCALQDRTDWPAT